MSTRTEIALMAVAVAQEAVDAAAWGWLDEIEIEGEAEPPEVAGFCAGCGAHHVMPGGMLCGSCFMTLPVA